MENSEQINELNNTDSAIYSEVAERMKEVNRVKKLYIGLVILCLFLLYFALFFIHNIVDMGTGDDSQLPNTTDSNVLDESEDNSDKQDGKDNNTGNNGNMNGNQDENELNQGESGQNGSNGNGSDGNGSGGNSPDGNNPGGNGSDNEGPGGSQSGDDGNDDIVDNSDRFKIFEGDKEWNDLKQLDIFKNSYFKNQSKIAPGVHGSYNFTVENFSDATIKYDAIFSEENPYNINMVFKLKVNGNYVAGDSSNWVDYAELNRTGALINAQTKDLYTIEWKWEDAQNDTEVGTTYGSYYRMRIQVNAEDVPNS